MIAAAYKVGSGAAPVRELPDSPLSLWLAEYGEYVPEAPLAGEVDVDVAVIGGGLTGMAAAIALKRRDPSLDVAVLEARTVGYGASGRNGSFAMTVIGLGFGTTALMRGKRFLQRAHSYMESCVDRLEEFIDEAGLECDKVRPGFLRVATAPSYVRRLQKQVELMDSLGFEGISWIDAASTLAFAVRPPTDYVASHTKFFDLLEAGAADAACTHMSAYFERHDSQLESALGGLS